MFLCYKKKSINHKFFWKKYLTFIFDFSKFTHSLIHYLIINWDCFNINRESFSCGDMDSINNLTMNRFNKTHRLENKWIAIYTKARHEKRVQSQLELMGIEAYVPLKKEYHRWSDRIKLVDVPLIPSYVFARPNPTQSLKIFTIDGIAYVVKFNGQIAVIRDEDIELLKKAEKCKEVELVSTNEYKGNEEVEIVEGIFAGRRGRVVMSDNRCRVGIRIEPIEYSLVVEIDSRYVRLLVPVVT